MTWYFHWLSLKYNKDKTINFIIITNNLKEQTTILLETFDFYKKKESYEYT